MNEQAQIIERRIRRWRRVKIAAIVVLLLGIVLAGVVCWQLVSGGRDIEAALQRCREAGEPVDPEDFAPPPVADEDNAALALRAAVGAMVLTEDQRNGLGPYPTDPREADAHFQDIAEVIEANGRALGLVREARAMTGVDWGVRIVSPGAPEIMGLLSDQRHLALLLAGAARCHAHQGRSAEAVETLCDLLAQAGVIAEIPAVVTHLVSIGLDNMASREIEAIAPRLAVRPDARGPIEALIPRLLDERRARAAVARAIHGERMTSVTALQQGPGRRAAFFFAADCVRIIEYTSVLAKAASEPTWPAAKAKLPADPQENKSVTAPMFSMLAPSLDRMVEQYFHGLAQRRMAAIALAIRLFESDTGKRPDKLEQLVPDYLPAVPADPFSPAGAPIRYAPHATPPLLYSVGPNGADEKGLVAKSPNGRPDREAGDMVFFLDGQAPR